MIRHVAVIVPAADEQLCIGACLQALTAARDAATAAREIAVEVIVVLDGCADGTADVVAEFPDVLALEVAAGGVAAARDVGSRTALARATVAPAEVLTLHTDADSLVPLRWIVEHLRHADAGAQLVLGTVEPDLDEPVRSRWRALHHDRDGHPHVHGANLGVRGDVLLAMGGWPPMSSGEDVALVEFADAAGVAIRRVGGLSVATSARRVGRAPCGFSSYLRDLESTTADSLTDQAAG